MKERLTVTLDKEIVHLVDHYVDGIKIKNRSHAIEVLLKEKLGEVVPKKAFILAGGMGTRLRPITREIPKAMIPVQGRTLLEHILDLLKKFGVTEIILSIGHLGDKIKRYFKDGKRFGVRITYVEEDEPLGTAGALRSGKHLLSGNFIVCNVDELKDIDIEEMMEMHKSHNALVTMALTNTRDTSRFGVAEMQGDRIAKFVEKPEPGTEDSTLINAGFYIMNMAAMEFIPTEGFASLEKDVFPKIAEQDKMFGYLFLGQWYSINNPENYNDAIDKWVGIKK